MGIDHRELKKLIQPYEESFIGLGEDLEGIDKHFNQAVFDVISNLMIELKKIKYLHITIFPSQAYLLPTQFSADPDLVVLFNKREEKIIDPQKLKRRR